MTRSAEIRAKLDHPIIDCDGHMLEYQPVFMDYLKQVGGSGMVRRYVSLMREHMGPYWFHLKADERRQIGAPRGPWWATPARLTDDRATALLPAMLRQRLDSFGIDFSIVYPTFGLLFVLEEDAELRQAICRALNVMHADSFRGHGDRLTPAATVPMHSPEEAIAEARYAVQELGYKVIMISGFVRRQIPEVQKLGGEAARFSRIIDNLAIDSVYNYDPFWQTCLDLKVVPAVHSSMMGEGSRVSPTNYVFNHIGMFSTAHEAFAKALVMGGVTHRFPDLKFAFLEGGVGWAIELCNGLAAHWEKRNRHAMQNYNPDNLDVARLIGHFETYGGAAFQAPADRLRQAWERIREIERDRCELLDEFALSGAESGEDLIELLTRNFYFGCEADDRLVGLAFDPRFTAGGKKLKPIFGSDIGHWDVADMTTVVAEAYEQVEAGRLTPEQFRQFTCVNPWQLYTSSNPDFFAGTSVAGLGAQVSAAG